MTEWHISEAMLGRFLRMETAKEESRRVVRHLISGCPQCTELAYRVTSEIGLFSAKKNAGATGWEQAYAEVFQRALVFATEEEQRLALEKLRGWAQWASLAPLTPRVRFAVVESDRSYHTWGLYDRLLEASREYIRTDPAEAVDIVRLAILVAERLDTAVIGKKRVADLRASAWAVLGNAKRLASDFEGARRAFNEAWKTLEEEGTNDLIERAVIISLEASYMNDIGEFETAEAALEDALEIYGSVGDPHQQGRILLQMGDAIGHIDPERGLQHIRKALALIDVAKEQRLELCAQHDLAWYLNDLGKPEEALSVLDRARPLYQQFPDRYTQLRLHWLEGRIAFRIGEYSEAESIFQQLWEEFRVRDLNHELVLVTIDLAETMAHQGEPARAAELIEQCHPIMKSWGLHRYALAAWLMLQKALAHRQIGDIFTRIREYYRRHWVRPAMFE